MLHRVVCCYPDVERLLAAVADHTKDVVVLSHPPRNAVTIAGLGIQNAVFRLMGRTYRSFVHRPELMIEVLERHGLRVVHTHHGLAWHVVAMSRR